MRKFLEKALVGVGIGYLITTVFLLKFAQYYTGPELMKVYGVWAVFGAAAGSTSLLFDHLENKLIATALHFSLIFTLWAGGMYLTVPNLDLSIIFFASIQFAIIYIIIYTVEYFYSKKNINAINQSIKNKK